MSNLGEIIGDVNDILDHDPKLASYKKATRRRINEKYLEISGRHPWGFLHRWATYTFYPNVLGSLTSSPPATIWVAPGTREVVGTGTAFAAHYEGHTIRIGTEEYRIVAVVASASALYIDRTIDAGVAAGTSDWEIDFKKYPFPRDMGEPLGIMDRDGLRGRFIYLDARTEEDLLLNPDEEGGPFIYIEAETENDRTPEEAPTCALAAGAGLSADTEYEYCYTILAYGRESPPSRSASIKTSSASRVIVVSNIEDLTYGFVTTGRQKRLYRRNKTKDGRWLFLAQMAESDPSYADDGSVTPSKEEDNVLYENGPQPSFRVWFRPSVATVVEMRYVKQPRELQSDSDAPIWPKAFHPLLKHEVLVEAALKHGAAGLAREEQRLADILLSRMKMKHLSRTDRLYQRKGFDVRPTGERWGVPTKVA